MESTLKIQAIVRSKLSRSRFAKIVSNATRIQRVYRGKLGRGKILDLKVIRALELAENIKRNTQARDEAAVKIQSIVRRNADMQIVYEKREEQEEKRRQQEEEEKRRQQEEEEKRRQERRNVETDESGKDESEAEMLESNDFM